MSTYCDPVPTVDARNGQTNLLGVMLLLFVLVIEVPCSYAAVITASSPSLSDVAAAVALAKNGDGVLVPAGTSVWTAKLVITNGIVLQGAGMGSTIIVDEVPRSGPTPYLLGATLGITPWPFRLTGFTFRGGVSNTANADYLIRFDGRCHTARIDHCRFSYLHGSYVRFTGEIYGVVDHCIFEGSHTIFITVLHDGWNGGSWGDRSWADDSYFGSAKFVFVENNSFYDSIGYPGVDDCFGGGRLVLRFNTCTNTILPGGHGTESSGRYRGMRAIEAYNNMVIVSNSLSLGQFRSGTGLIFSNTYIGPFSSAGCVMACYRMFAWYPSWGWAAGVTNFPFSGAALDSNAPGAPFARGVHAGTNGSALLLDTNANWTANQWAGYSIVDTNTGLGGFIQSNTSNAIYFGSDNADFQLRTNATFNTGDGYWITKVLIALDQPCRGKGDLLTGYPPYNTATGAPSWPREASDPVYAWSNTVNGSSYTITAQVPTMQPNRDFYNDTIKPGYKPYTYPHPLVTSNLPVGAGNLRIKAGP